MSIPVTVTTLILLTVGTFIILCVWMFFKIYNKNIQKIIQAQNEKATKLEEVICSENKSFIS